MSAHAAAVHGGGKRHHKKHEEHEEHENHERWLVTYADMITLLMVLFIVLFAIGQTDLEKFKQLQLGLADGFAGEPGVLDSGSGFGDGGSSVAPQELQVELTREAQAAIEALDAARQQVAEDQAALEGTADQIREQLDAAGVGDGIELNVERRGLIVTIVTDQVLFAPGSADLVGDASALLGPIAETLAGMPNDITIEGHTDDRPISGGRFPSNWELSTARATSVLRLLESLAGIEPTRVSVAGYADTHPIDTNETAAGRARNRRVEIVVHTTVEEADVVQAAVDQGDPEPIPGQLVAVGDPIPEVDSGQEEE